jgi:hypothetical protein
MFHILIALAVQISFGLLTSDYVTGAVPICGFYVGREIAQAEYRWIEHYGNGLRANMPWYGPFDPRVWHKLDAWIDWLGPLICCALVAIILPTLA